MEVRKITREEVYDIIAWLKGHPLPESLRLDKSYNIPDLKKTIEALTHNVEQVLANPNRQGELFLLERIKKKLEEDEKSQA